MNKLELTWVGKDKKIEVEPRLLVEDPEKSYCAEADDLLDSSINDNILIHGDNLLALKALEAKYAGQVKCIYIDPPYNTGNAFEHYDDGLEHSLWLSLMRDRLEILWNLLASDGLLAIQIDDNEFARLYLLLIEICGEKNLKNICVKMSEASGLKMGAVKKNGTIPKLKEFIIVAKKDGIRNLYLESIPKKEWDSEYNIFLENFSKKDKDKIDKINEKGNINDADIQELDSIANKVSLKSLTDKLKQKNLKTKNEKDKWCIKNAYRICQCATSASVLKLSEKKKKQTNNPLFFVKSVNGEIAYFVRATYSSISKKPRLQLIFAEDNLSQHPGDLWTNVKTTGLDNEGKVKFKNGKKPEDLIRRIIAMNTKPRDLVLDSFLGSGTTAAVAHKMGRRWIGVEMGEHAYTHCKVRLDKVIDGEDKGGITKAVNWQGGGGYKFYELAPTLINKDAFGVEVINKEYNADMLAAAVALHEGFNYQPSDELFWKQSIGTEKSFLYVTTSHLTAQYLDSIQNTMKDGEFLIIACKSFDKGIEKNHKNIGIKKIPQMLLSKCEFGKDDYSLNIINPPVYEDEGECCDE